MNEFDKTMNKNPKGSHEPPGNPKLYGPSRGHVELTQHFQIFPMCLFKKHVLEGVALQNLPTTFRIYPPPSEKKCVEAVGPFWTFFPKSQDPKNVDFGKNDLFEREL